jgi:peptidoglycan/xylan/chitin deacetylase (PgdA/CDA1 family)
LPLAATRKVLPVGTLMYHDIVPPGAEDSSGFRGRDAALYKISPDRFRSHLIAILSRSAPRTPLLTFDDGGESALVAADELERCGLRGWFFVPTRFIGTRGFLDARGIRELAARGHQIGSHSCSHPLRMARCPRDQVSAEWRISRAVLTDILGADVRAASVPGGEYSHAVGETAASAGIEALFTSEPTRALRKIGSMDLCGRYTIQRWTSAKTAAALVSGAGVTCTAHAAVWAAKRYSKRIAGSWYLRVRERLLCGSGNEQSELARTEDRPTS